MAKNYYLNRLFSKKQKMCKGRSRTVCRTAKKRCLWASGTKRSFCRVKKSRRIKN